MQLPLKICVQDKMTFESFCIGKNSAVVTYLQAVVSGKEQFAYIWGGQSVGRSHLLQAVCNRAGELGCSSFYLPLARRHEWSPALLEDLESLQIVCLDDINLIAGESLWEEALLNLYNRLRDEARGLVIAGNTFPVALSIHLADLKSRLAWGNVFCVEPLSDDEKIKALQERAEQRGFSLPLDVVQFLFKRVSRNTGELFRTLNRLDEASLGAKRRLTIPFVKEVLNV